MGITKTDLFTEEQNTLAITLKALGHPARIAIIQHLIQANACINGDLVEETGLAQATVSQHLRELKSLGIIQGTIEGVSVSYCINPIRWKEIEEMLKGLFEQFNIKNNCC